MKSDLESPDLPRFADLDAEYEILRELGRGGTAVVYLARERELGREVAIKVIRATYIEDEEAAARLVREARTVASLQHPNIVMLYGTRRLGDNSLALIMQYVPGRTLKSEVQARGPFPFDRVEQVLTDLGRALACAQRHRIVHRDIKPENVYLDEEAGIARLSDFGIARPWDTEQGLTLPGMAIGTPAYMSPEQIDGGELDGRSDLYSLGLVGYEMLTGRAPWAGESLFSMIYKQKHEALLPLEELRPAIPALLCRALEGTLRKNRDERWTDADEFLAALSGKLAAPERRTAIESDSASTAAASSQADSATIQYRRGDVPRPDCEPPTVKTAQSVPAAPPPDRLQRRSPGRERISYRRTAAEIVPYRESQAQPLAEAAQALALVEHVLADAELATRPRRRRAVLAATVPLLLLSTALILVVNRSGGEDALSVGITATARAQSAPVTGVEQKAAAAADARPVLAWPMYGNRQAGLAGDTLPEPLGLMVEDATGRPVVGVTIEFAITEGDGSVEPRTAVTDEAGVASTRWLLRQVGSHTVSATVADLSQTIAFSARALPRPPARITPVSPTELKGTLGAALGSPLVVRVADDRSDPVIGAQVRFTVRAGEGRISPATLVTGNDGTARVEWVLGQSGAQEAVAVLPDLPAARAVFRVTTRPGSLPIRRGVTVGGTHTCSLNVDGGADCWGGNDKGQLGDGSASRRNGPVSVVAPEPFSVLSAGVSHTCGVGVSGTVFCWGANGTGQLGDGTRVDRAQPVRLATEVPITSVFTGVSHSCGLDAGGRLFCWGQNTHGQLGDGTRTDRTAPVRAAGERIFRTVALGWAHTCGLTSDGAAFCWGRNPSGELGDGSTSDRTEPVPVSGGTRFAGIASGSGHTCGLTATGTVLCWGQNSYGQLGNNTTENSAVPVEVRPTDFFSAMALGSVHSCAITREGSARCWGRNTYGQLGDGTVENRLWPTPVAGGRRFNALQASGAHTCGTAGGATFCWGYNSEGQLGNGTRTNQTRPVAVNRQ